MDEACANTRVQLDSRPEEIDQLQVEAAALAQEKDKPSKLRLKAVRKELSDIEDQLAQVSTRAWPCGGVARLPREAGHS
jgi:ATP-dependent Clp protease ATP-binding subunit ClpB